MDNKKVPEHVSIIMDGNGRWASERGKERIYGHAEGVGSVRACTEAAVECGVKWLSLFAFSEENWGRPEKEVTYLMGMMVKCMHDELHTFMDNGVRFIVLGNMARLSEELKTTIDECMETTKANDRLNLVIFLSYSGKWDILQAAARYAADHVGDCGEPDFETFGKYLVTAGIPDPDLIIRTSGEQRLSNYMLWQSAYSELLFVDTLWPDFRKDDFRKALEEYSKRDRRYGKVK
ncbi:MAG: polyprenyl diphosphate synthase [Candidatus Cryptobacteroides sp.]